MTQHQRHNKAITWFKTSSHAMNAALVACAMLGSSAAWAVDPSVKQLRIGYQKASVNLVIAQRLARRLCSQCKKPADIPQQSLLEMGFTETDLQQPEFQIYEPVGCNECREGYKGRVGIYEVMKVTPEISRIIMEDGNALEIADASARAGFNNLRRSGLIKVMQGVTSLQEVNRVTSE